MSCPFKNLFLKELPPSGSSKRDREASRCPFTGATSLSPEPATASESSTVTAASQPHEDAHAATASSGPTTDPMPHLGRAHGVCPLGFTAPLDPPSGNPPPGPAPVCPYGYSSRAGPALTPLQCSLCHTFLHASASIEPCTHKFCRFESTTTTRSV